MLTVRLLKVDLELLAAIDHEITGNDGVVDSLSNKQLRAWSAFYNRVLATEMKPKKKVAGKMKLSMAQFRELEAFAQFSSDLDPETKKQIDLGVRLVEVLKQPQYRPMPVAHQVAIIYAVSNGFANAVAAQKRGDFSRLDGKADFEQHLTASIGGLEVRDLEHQASSPRYAFLTSSFDFIFSGVSVAMMRP